MCSQNTMRSYTLLWRGTLILWNSYCYSFSTEISDVHRESLDALIQLEEISVVIGLLKLNRSPGPDGLTAEL